jgi:hypothetical protein
MPTARTDYSTAKVKVAVVFEPERGMRPVWFEVLGEERVQVKEITASWSGSKGSVKIITFELWNADKKHSLEFNAENQTWRAGVTVIE